MKIINFKGGLGNQMFIYMFYCYLRGNVTEKIYGYYNAKYLRKHNGLEIDKVFEVELPKATLLSNCISLILRILRKFDNNTRLVSNDQYLDINAIYFDGYWQNKQFINGYEQKLVFKALKLDQINSKILTKINTSSSVSIHIRRGDYLEKHVIEKYGNVCTLAYYKTAIDIINNNFDNPFFFVFSNDMPWVKNNFELKNCIYVNENFEENSYLDMYLMSKCKANIISNSTFSFWAARLNCNSKLVIYPQKWYNNTNAPYIFDTNWLGL